MSRILWLAFEKPPHCDAVCHPATVDDVLFVLELLETPREHRERLSEQLQRYLASQAMLDPWSRPAVPCRRLSGLYSLVPWRLAKWLSVVLTATSSANERTRNRLESWLQTSQARVVNAAGG